MKIYINYKDDGPSGICGQTVDSTCPWDRLYIFKSYEEVEEFKESVNKIRGRMNPRIVNSWCDEYGQVFNIKGE